MHNVKRYKIFEFEYAVLLSSQVYKIIVPLISLPLVLRCIIDLSRLDREKTHELWQELDCGYGTLHLLITISGAVRPPPADSVPTTQSVSRVSVPEDKYVRTSTSYLATYLKSRHICLDFALGTRYSRSRSPPHIPTTQLTFLLLPDLSIKNNYYKLIDTTCASICFLYCRGSKQVSLTS